VGDKYERAQEMFGKSYATLVDYKAVAKAFKFPERSGNLPWSYYRAVA